MSGPLCVYLASPWHLLAGQCRHADILLLTPFIGSHAGCLLRLGLHCWLTIPCTAVLALSAFLKHLDIGRQNTGAAP